MQNGTWTIHCQHKPTCYHFERNNASTSVAIMKFDEYKPPAWAVTMHLKAMADDDDDDAYWELCEKQGDEPLP